MESGFKMDAWLGIMFSSALYADFTLVKKTLEESMDELKRQIELLRSNPDHKLVFADTEFPGFFKRHKRLLIIASLVLFLLIAAAVVVPLVVIASEFCFLHRVS